MTMRMSRGFDARWKDAGLDECLETVALQPRLRGLIGAPLVRKAGALVLEPLVANATGPEAFEDRTGYEAFVNKIHIDDFIDDVSGGRSQGLATLIQQGVKAAIELSRRLEGEGRFRVLLSLDEEWPTMTLRFFERRDGEPWGEKDPDAFPLEEVLMIDTGP